MAITLGKSRPISFIRQDFRDMGVKVGLLTSYRLAYYPESSYSDILTLVGRVSKSSVVGKLKIDPFESNAAVRFSYIPEEVIEDNCLKGQRLDVLDLRGIDVYLRGSRGKKAKADFLRSVTPVEAPGSHLPTQDKVRELLSILAVERKYFRALIEKPETTVEKLFKALAHGVEKFKPLGFNATIFVPVEEEGKLPEECRWREFYRSDRLGKGPYAGSEGSPAEDTLLSVIRSHLSFFKVSLEDLASFSSQGLDFNPTKVSVDMEKYKGSPKILIYRMESVAHSPEAVIYIRNRVKNDDFETPPRELFPAKDAPLIEEALNLYFDEVANAFSAIRQRTSDRRAANSGSVINPSDKMALLRYGQLLRYKDQRIRLFEVPSEKFFRNIDGVVNWLREAILGVYEGTRIAEGKNKDQLIRALSLESEKMYERVIYTRYLALVEGESPNEHNLLGVVSGNVLDLNGRIGPVFKVPEAMISKAARGRKLEVAISYEMGTRTIRKRWAELGLFKGFFHMLFTGIPFYATTQSLRVAKDMLRLKDLSLLRIVRGKELSEVQKIVIERGSSGKADRRGVEPDAYGGRIAIDEEEKGIVLRKPIWLTTLPVIRTFFAGYLRNIAEENEMIIRFFKQEIGKRGRVHLVGHFTIGVALKVWLELTLGHWFKPSSKSK